MDCEVVEESDHAGPELLGGQGVGLRAAAQHGHLGSGEDGEVRGEAEVLVPGVGVVQVGGWARSQPTARAKYSSGMEHRHCGSPGSSK